MNFQAALSDSGIASLTRDKVETVQVNIGKLCNQACHHCHVEAGPKRTEQMTEQTARRLGRLLENSPGVRSVDLTGGAPELNENFRDLVRHARALGLNVIDRCNLTVLFEPGMEDLADFLTEQGVEVVASLPCYSEENVDKQRGVGVFDKSIAALRDLNTRGYGQAGSPLRLNLVYNPVGAFLPPDQRELELQYRAQLRDAFGIEFSSLITITNMPIKRFAEQLSRNGEHDTYMSLLVNHFNIETIPGLMCRSMVSIGYDGSLYDCDFNQMLEIPLQLEGRDASLNDLDSFAQLGGTPIETYTHCFGCTAGAGSSCGGALAD